MYLADTNQKEADIVIPVLDILDIKERSHAKNEKVRSIVIKWTMWHWYPIIFLVRFYLFYRQRERV